MSATTQSVLTAFPPVSRHDARLLILGSMPGVASLDAQRYYAHPQNAFWFIMATIYGTGSAPESYEHKLSLIQDAGVALWDVLKHCVRPGSLDSKIDRKSVVCNNFDDFLEHHPNIQLIAFNGKAAAQLFSKHVTGERPTQIPTVSLPSSSPAMATLTRHQKANTWQQALITI